MVAASELPIDTGASALEMAEAIFGDGTTVTGATYYGNNAASGIYSDADTVSPGVAPADEGVILSTGRARDFTNNGGDANQSDSTSTNVRGGIDNFSGFNDLAGVTTFDGSVLDVFFVPTGDTLTLQFTFASEEYPEYSNSIFNDVVGIWVNGQQAEITVGDGQTSVGSLNQTTNENLYVDNTSSQYNTEMDGFTVTLTVKADVNAGETNSLRLGIADAGDTAYDSNLLIAAGSAQTSLVAADDSVTLAPGGSKTIDVLDNDSAPGGVTLTVTHINNIAVSPGDSVVLTTGEEVTLNADGTLTLEADAGEESINFSYTVSDGAGLSDTAFVTADIVPCFVAGTGILTPEGERPVEDLSPGDRVITRDHGAQPLRWIGRRRVPAEGDLAPIRIAAGTFGAHGTLLVSPQHRILIRNALAELLFGEGEVLVAAKHLTNDCTVTRRPGGMVEYVHLLFDRHEVVYSAGLPSESFQPGPQTTASFEAEALAELARIFPGLDPRSGTGYGASARPTLKAFEAALLVGHMEPA